MSGNQNKTYDMGLVIDGLENPKDCFSQAHNVKQKEQRHSKAILQMKTRSPLAKYLWKVK